MTTKQTVILDSSVLYQAPVRDLLLQLAFKNTYKARWTNLIHEEWISNLLKNRPDIPKEALQATQNLMNRRILGCLVNGFENRIEGLTLPDPDDRHVLAAAIESHANIIVTFNLRDFPNEVLENMTLKPCTLMNSLFASLFRNQACYSNQRKRSELGSKPLQCHPKNISRC